MSKRLYDCTTAVERLDWIKARLNAGHTVAENTLLLGGIEVPHRVIAGLRASGLRIEAVTVDLVDAQGVMHRGRTAWRLSVGKT